MAFGRACLQRFAVGSWLGLAAVVAHPASLALEAVDEGGVPLADVAVALEPVGARPPAAAAHARSAEVVQQGKRFIPLVTALQTGAAVHFPNRDTVRHHVYSFSPAKTFELKLYIGTPAEPVVFDKPGVVAMGCNIHDQMAAYVVVFDSPWVGVTDGAGVLRLEGVPPGDYQLAYWHPRWAGASDTPVRVPLRLDAQAVRRLVIGARP